MNIFKKVGAAVLAAALMATTAPAATTAYADETQVEKLKDGLMASELKVYDISEGTHTYQIDFENTVSWCDFAIKDDKRAKYLCEVSWDDKLNLLKLIPKITNTTEDGYDWEVNPSSMLDNLNGVEEKLPGIYYFNIYGAPSASFTFETTGRKSESGNTPVILFGFENSFAGSAKFTIKPLDSEAQTPEDEKPGETEKKTVEFKNEETNVSVSAGEGIVPEGAELSVTPGEITDTKANYNICFMKDGKEVQPNGKVTVRMPLPEGLKGKPVYIYRVEADGKYTYLKSKVEGDFVSFETDHFSKYLLSTEALENATPENPDTGVAGIGFTVALAAIGGAVTIISRKKR